VLGVGSSLSGSSSVRPAEALLDEARRPSPGRCPRLVVFRIRLFAVIDSFAMGPSKAGQRTERVARRVALASCVLLGAVYKAWFGYPPSREERTRGGSATLNEPKGDR